MKALLISQAPEPFRVHPGAFGRVSSFFEAVAAIFEASRFLSRRRRDLRFA